MSDIFSLTRESAIPSSLFARSYSRENFIVSTISTLESVNNEMVEKTKALYTAVYEADSVEKESSEVKNYINQMQETLDKLARDIKSSTARFTIAATNYCDTATAQADAITGDLTDFKYKGEYTEYNKEAMLNPYAPSMNPYRVFERDFNFIGSLMQDLPVTASNKDKLEIVSTVYKNFKQALDSTTLEKVYQDLFGAAECKDKAKTKSIGKFVSCMFKKGHEDDYKIDYDVYSDALDCVTRCKEYCDTIESMSDALIRDLASIINDLNVLVTGDNKGKFTVNTKEDGIKNTTYSVDKVTSNKIMWLVQEKINQIVDIFNKYILALSIKMDCILGYIKQSSSIIDAFKFMDCKNGECKKDEVDDDTEDNDVKDTEKEPAEPESDDDEDKDDEDDNTYTEEDEEESKEDNALDGGDDILTPEDETENDVEAGEEKEEVPSFDEEDEDDISEAMNEYLIAAHEMSYAIGIYSIFEHATNLILEADEPESAPSKTKQLVDSVADKKRSAWGTIIDKLLNIWNRFKESLKESYQEKVNRLEKDYKYIKMDVSESEISMPKISVDDFNKITIPDLDYQNMKEHLKSKDDFIKEYFKDIMKSAKDGDTLSKKIQDYCMDYDHPITNSTEVNKNDAYDYCRLYPVIADEFSRMTKIFEDGQRKANQLAKQIKATSETALTLEQMYFNEADDDKKEQDFKVEDKDKGTEDKSDKKASGTDYNSKKGDEKEQKEIGDIESHLKNYFSACGDAFVAKINVSRKIFNNYYNFLQWHIGKKKEAESNGGNKGSGESAGTEKERKFT